MFVHYLFQPPSMSSDLTFCCLHLRYIFSVCTCHVCPPSVPITQHVFRLDCLLSASSHQILNVSTVCNVPVPCFLIYCVPYYTHSAVCLSKADQPDDYWASKWSQSNHVSPLNTTPLCLAFVWSIDLSKDSLF